MHTTKPTRPRSLLKRTLGLATLVCVGVAETACNLQVAPRTDTGPRTVDSGAPDAGTDASNHDAATTP